MTSLSQLSRRVRLGSSSGFDRKLIAPLVLGTVLNPINSSMIAVALVPIGLALGASPAQTAWLVSGLYVATAVGQPVGGRLVDRYGPRKVYLVATALVGIAGVLGMLAPTLAVLVAARVVLGFGTCAGYPAAMTLIRSEADRTGIDSPSGVLATLAVSAQTVAVIGPTLGGLVLVVTGWRGILAVNVPLALACAWLGRTRLPRDPQAQRDRWWWSALDATGMVLFATALVSAIGLLMHPTTTTPWLLVPAVLAGAGFVWRESRVVEPFIDLRPLWANRPLQLTYLRQLLAFTVSYSFLYGFTQWLEAGHGLTASQTGLLLLPMFLVAIVVTSTTGRHPQVRGKLVVGGVFQVAACTLLLVLTPVSPVALLLVLVALVGVPQGLVSLGNQNALYHQADPSRMGSSAGLLRTFSYLGAIAAAAATAAAYRTATTTSGLHQLAAGLVAVAVVFLVVVLLDRSLARIGKPTPTT